MLITMSNKFSFSIFSMTIHIIRIFETHALHFPLRFCVSIWMNIKGFSMRYVLNVRKPQHLKQVTKKTELISLPIQDFLSVLNGYKL